MSKFLEFNGTDEIIVVNFENLRFKNMPNSTRRSFENYQLNDSEDKTIFCKKIFWNS